MKDTQKITCIMFVLFMLSAFSCAPVFAETIWHGGEFDDVYLGGAIVY